MAILIRPHAIHSLYRFILSIGPSLNLVPLALTKSTTYKIRPPSDINVNNKISFKNPKSTNSQTLDWKRHTYS